VQSIVELKNGIAGNGTLENPEHQEIITRSHDAHPAIHPKSLGTILQSTGKGVTVNLVCRFLNKASTDDKAALRPTVPQKVVMEIDRAYIMATDVDVQMPKRIARGKPKAEPLAVREDVAYGTVVGSRDSPRSRLSGIVGWSKCDYVPEVFDRSMGHQHHTRVACVAVPHRAPLLGQHVSSYTPPSTRI
jgi:hypothetical protein